MISMRKLGLIVGTFLILALVVVACSPAETETIIETRMVEVEKEVTRVVEGEVITETVIEEVAVEVTREVIVEPEPEPEAPKPVTLSYNLGTEPPSLDPSLTTDTTSVTLTQNLFCPVVNIDPITSEVIPMLATEWEEGTDADGNQTWTFHLRDDIAWVHYDLAIQGSSMPMT